MKLHVLLAVMLLVFCQSVLGQETDARVISWDNLSDPPPYAIAWNQDDLERVSYERDTLIVIDAFESNRSSTLNGVAQQALRDLIEAREQGHYLVYVTGLTDESTRPQFGDTDNKILEDQLAESRARAGRNWLERHAGNWDCRLSPAPHYDDAGVRGIAVQIWKERYTELDREFQREIEDRLSETRDDVKGLEDDVNDVKGEVASISSLQFRAGVGLFGFHIPGKFGVRAPGIQVELRSGQLGIYGSIASTRGLDSDEHYATLGRFGALWQINSLFSVNGGFVKGKWVDNSPGVFDTVSGGEAGLGFTPISDQHWSVELGGSWGYYDVISDRTVELDQGILHYGEKRGSYGGGNYRLLIAYAF